MNCPIREELLASTREHDPHRARELERHAAECAECRAINATLEDVRAVLGPAPRPLSSAARARMWEALEAQAERAPWWRLDLARWGAIAATASLVIGLLALWPRAPNLELEVARGVLADDADADRTLEPGAALRAGEVLAAQGEATLAGPGTSVALAPGARFGIDASDALAWMSGDDLALALVLEAGSAEITFAPEPMRRLTVRTPTGRLELFASRVRVEVDAGGTTLLVHEGAVRWVPTDGAAASLRAGERRRFTRAEDLSRSATQVADPPDAGDAEAAELARRADALRRGGQLDEAARAYAMLAELPSAAGYAEEAELRRAQIFAQLGRSEAALDALDASHRRFPGGTLAPERAVLAAEIFLARGAVTLAAAAVERIEDELSTEALSAKRVEVADRLITTDPARARALAERVARTPTTRALKSAAIRVARDAARRASDESGTRTLDREQRKLEAP